MKRWLFWTAREWEAEPIEKAEPLTKKQMEHMVAMLDRISRRLTEAQAAVQFIRDHCLSGTTESEPQDK